MRTYILEKEFTDSNGEKVKMRITCDYRVILPFDSDAVIEIDRITLNDPENSYLITRSVVEDIKGDLLAHYELTEG